MNDDFQLVKYKKRSKRKHPVQRITEVVVTSALTNPDSVKRKIEDAYKLLVKSEFFSNLISLVIAESPAFDQIFCYGLGNFSESYASRLQLAALLGLQHHFQCKVTSYDPIFSAVEIKVLELLGIQVEEKNSEGKLSLKPSTNTLIYFSHCSKQLVNNFLWANWGPSLKTCILLTNSFSTILVRNTNKTLASLSCIRDINEITKEIPIDDTFEVSGVFNDLSVHSFLVDKVKNTEFWEPRPEPQYVDQDIEFITKEIAIKFTICN